MFRSTVLTLLAAALVFALAGCGDDDNEGVTTPVTPPPNVAGKYNSWWTLQVLRKSDGFQKEFRCIGDVTLQQSGTSGSTAVLSGWVSVGPPCTPESYDLTGLVSANGAVEFATNAPAPPEGPCPRGEGVSFSGQVTPASGGDLHILSARGVTNVTCPQFGEHQFTYFLEGRQF
jgi:hypothetical protein